MCQFRFMEAGSCFHVCSQENHPVLFHNEEEFKSVMNVVAFAAILSQSLKIYTFEVMDNHFHFTMAGERGEIDSFIRTLVIKLSSQPALSSYRSDIRTLEFKILSIDSLDNMRNVIAYVNRNGAVVSPDENVFSYRWGANRYFFNREARMRYADCGHKATCRQKREIFRSSQLDNFSNVVMLDGYVSPLCYCLLNEAESFFRNSRHYFYSVSRNMEATKDIAKTIGEFIFYSDEDLYSHIRMRCSKNYGCQSAAVLDPESKIELAKELHFGFNAGNRQICRLLKMDIGIVNTLFPGK